MGTAAGAASSSRGFIHWNEHSNERLGRAVDGTIRFVVKNNGVLLHEIVIGTPVEMQKHAVMMAKFPNMVHDEPYMAHVGPGKQGTVTWNFNRLGEFEFACLLPGHYQTGMKGKITVKE